MLKLTGFVAFSALLINVAAKAEKDFHFLSQQRTRTSQAQVFEEACRGSGAFV